MKIGRLFGIEIRLDFSVAIIFALVVYSLGASLFPSWHADWSGAQVWSISFAAGILFFASLLAHELAHSVVAKRRGIDVPRITLFVFGGISELAHEPDDPASEFLIAIVGPITSLVLGVVFLYLGYGFAGEAFLTRMAESPETAMAALGPVATLLLWLGPVNILLGLFNVVPGFPLDGGRVLRAIVWWYSGDLERATRIAANSGKVVAWGLMAFGVFELLQGVGLQGLWFILIGWFLQVAAKSTQTQSLLRQAVTRLRARDLMRTRFESVSASMPLASFMRDCLLRSGQPVWPVVEGERLLGTVSFDDARSRLAEAEDVTVRDVMRPVTTSIDSGVSGKEALEALLGVDHDPLPVVDDGRIVGLLYRADIMRWLALHQLKCQAH